MGRAETTVRPRFAAPVARASSRNQRLSRSVLVGIRQELAAIMARRPRGRRRAGLPAMLEEHDHRRRRAGRVDRPRSERIAPRRTGLADTRQSNVRSNCVNLGPVANRIPPRRDRPTLAERAMITRRIEEARAGPRPASDGPADPPSGGAAANPPAGGSAAQSADGGRHCWVIDPVGVPGRWPGLLTQWRRTPAGGWCGLVIFSVDLGIAVPVLIQAWLDADQLEALPPER